MAVETSERLLVNKDDAAYSLGISLRKLERLVNEGQIVIVRVGRSVRVPTDSLRRYVERISTEQDGRGAVT